MSLRDEAKIGVEPCEAVKREFTASEASKPLIDRRKEAYRLGRIQQLVLLDLTQLINQLLHADPRPSRLRLLVDRLQ